LREFIGRRFQHFFNRKNMVPTHVKHARRVISIERAAIEGLTEQLTEDFSRAVDAILASPGRVVVCGMGKSGLIGQKIAATLASTGTQSFFLHPGEAFHGDLGMLAPQDVFLAISYSGETEEVIRLLPFIADNGNVLISITGKANSTLATNAHYHIGAKVEQEACPLQLAPTASTTAALVIGDALAVALIHARKFEPTNFARFHPGGSLGKRLLSRVRNVMRVDDLPLVYPDAEAITVVHQVSAGRAGMVIVHDKRGVAGIITDGDLRRAMERHQENFIHLKAIDMMTHNPRSISPSAHAEEALMTMKEAEISSLLVVEEGQLLGIVQIRHCLL
jgi:arabinose-5-phosphate isomerase